MATSAAVGANSVRTTLSPRSHGPSSQQQQPATALTISTRIQQQQPMGGMQLGFQA